jgi:hypothetical protein
MNLLRPCGEGQSMRVAAPVELNSESMGAPDAPLTGLACDALAYRID